MPDPVPTPASAPTSHTVTMAPLGIIAGAGQFPAQVARVAASQGRRVVMVGFAGHTDPALAVAGAAVAEPGDFLLLHLGQLGKLIAFFHRHGVKELCLAGAVNKPRALDLRPDLRALKLLFSMRGTGRGTGHGPGCGTGRGKGDDALFTVIIGELAREGFTVVQAASFVPDLFAPQGVLTRRAPDGAEMDDIRFGWPIARTMGALDIGQLIVVRSGIVVAVEAMEGTDATLARGGALGGAGCVAIKIFKPGQDERVDQPAIGPGTIKIMAEHGYRCLAFEAGKTLLFDREEAVRLANAAGIAMIGLMPEEPDGIGTQEETA